MPVDIELLEKIHKTYDEKLKAGERVERKALAEAWGEHVPAAAIPYEEGDENETLEGLGPNTNLADGVIWDAACKGNRAAQKWLRQANHRQDAGAAG